MSKVEAQWQRMQFKGNKVWMMVNTEGNPIVRENKVLIKYNLKQDYEYWVHEKSISDIDSKQLKQNFPGKKKFRHEEKSSSKKAAIHETARQQDAVVIFTDGASSGNPGPAGIGVVMRHGEHKKEISKAIGKATNNIAELEAIRAGLAALKNTHLPVRVFTDSAYAQGVLSLGWKAQKNTALVRSVKQLMSQFKDIELIKVPAHSGIADNERSDALAVAGAKANKKKLKSKPQGANDNEAL